MRLYHGDTKSLTNLDWAQVELNIHESARPMQIEGVVVRTGLWGRKFGAFELVVPVEKVRPSGMELVVPSLFARTRELTELRGIESVWGVDGLAEDRGGNVLRVPDEFVQGLMERERKRNPVRMGGVVRILWGPERMLCGTVARLNGRMITVEVETRSRKVRATLPVTAVETFHTSERDYFFRG